MRIIAGRLKGLRLTSFRGEHLRPTTDRVKESIFNKLQGEIENARILDLFSGTGNLAFEAISRGANMVEAVELSRVSLAIIRENAQKLGVPIFPNGPLKVVASEVCRYLGREQDKPFDLIFADPPFTEKMAHKVLECVAASQAMGAQSLLMIEASSHERVDAVYPHSLGDLQREDMRDYGDKKISYFKRKSVE